MTGAERITGEDGIFLRLERPDTPTHTLKVAVLDTSRRGAAITLEELTRAVAAHLHLTPRSTQRIGRLRGTRTWAWVEDETFDLANHLDEVVAPAPGDRDCLDQICTEVHEQVLSRQRPLWSMTLVHGLEGGRQAVIIRIHHAISDGKAAVNLLDAVTTASPGGSRNIPKLAHNQAGGHGFADLLASSWEHTKRLREFGSRKDLPSLSRRTVLNPRGQYGRRCVSADLDFEDLRSIARQAGVSVNGAFHGVVAGAIRRELLERGHRSDRKLIAAFGIADDAEAGRRYGNSFATSFAFLHADLEDPLERLAAAAENASRVISLRRATGFDFYRSAVEYQQHLIPTLRVLFGTQAPIVGNQITLANVPGPVSRRWIGDIEIVEWISHAITISPIAISLTAYSYAGRLSLGLTVAPQAVPDARAFLDRFEDSMNELLTSLSGKESLPPPATGRTAQSGSGSSVRARRIRSPQRESRARSPLPG